MKFAKAKIRLKQKLWELYTFDRFFKKKLHGDSEIPFVRLGELGRRGLVHRDINESTKNKKEISRRPFKVRELKPGDDTDYPILSALEADASKPGRESSLIVAPDRRGIVRPYHQEKAKRHWQNVSQVCFNSDFGFGSQRLAACLTPTPVLGGRAWPGLICSDRSHDIPLVLWMNSSIGLFSFWCVGSRQQNGRSCLTITRLPLLPIIDLRQLTEKQIKLAERIFDEFSTQELLPANEAYRDKVRQKLDQAVLIELLGLPSDILGPMALLRDLWCAKPTVRDTKNLVSKG